MSYDRNIWPQEEIDALLASYRLGGLAAARKVLPHRSDSAIRNKASDLSLNYSNAEFLAHQDAKAGSALLLEALLRMNDQRRAA